MLESFKFDYKYNCTNIEMATRQLRANHAIFCCFQRHGVDGSDKTI
jgi:hypothetical protein